MHVVYLVGTEYLLQHRKPPSRKANPAKGLPLPKKRYREPQRIPETLGSDAARSEASAAPSKYPNLELTATEKSSLVHSEEANVYMLPRNPVI